ncbi:MAG: type II toxin-antitoxin system VapC family toxin [Synechococcus sp. SB0677_bin_5]|nr:type II toxin-antitoxin system VapC family toxin [Synechococcus sp. SB0677_bin_5]
MNADLVGYPAAVLDASALVVAILKSGERENHVLSFLWQRRCYCSMINWFEIESLVDDVYEQEDVESSWDDIKKTFISDYYLTIEEFTLKDAEWVVEKEKAHGSCLLMPRLSCLALGHRLDFPVVTADRVLTQERWIDREVKVILI